MALATAILNFEGTIPAPMLNVTGHIHYTEGPNGIPLNLNAVQTDQSVEIVYHWNQSGWLLPLLGSCQCHFEVFLERMGEFEFGPIAPKVIPFSNTSGSFVTNVTIPANTVPPGLYRITARFMLTATGGSASPCVGFADLGFANWYIAMP